VLLLNGVGADERSWLAGELDGVAHRTLALAQPVQDLAAYGRAAAELEHDRLCFLNSYSEVLAGGWLAKLDAALAPADVGAAAATGSWASLRSLALNSLGLPNAYRGSLPGRREVFRGMQEMQGDLRARRADAGAPAPAGVSRMRAAAVAARETGEQIVRFPAFPDPHLRTNALVCDRALFGSLGLGGARRKLDAYALESGRRGITRRLRRMGLRAVVVDRHGTVHDTESWPESATFWQGEQEGLLVADNQTGAYAAGGHERRRLLAGLAWGRRARPRPPG
jgi:hypothetical protein